jgi:hypothetical protein
LKGDINATVCSEEKRLEVEGGADRWGPPGSEKEGKGEGTGSVSFLGCGLARWLLGWCFGPAQVAEILLSFFFYSGSFLFVFCFVSYLLQNSFKSIQTNF